VWNAHNTVLGSIQPFGHNTPSLQTDRHTGQTQRSESIGRTVLQTVAQKASTKPVSIKFVAWRLDNFVVGLTNNNPATTAPVYKSSYRLCGQYHGSVALSASVDVLCAPSSQNARFVIVQGSHPTYEAICFTEVSVYTKSGIITRTSSV